MKAMKVIFKITIHPIDTKLLDKLNINWSSQVEQNRLGSVLRRLMVAGYQNIKPTTSVPGVVEFHCMKHRDENSTVIKNKWFGDLAKEQEQGE